MNQKRNRSRMLEKYTATVGMPANAPYGYFQGFLLPLRTPRPLYRFGVITVPYRSIRGGLTINRNYFVTLKPRQSHLAPNLARGR